MDAIAQFKQVQRQSWSHFTPFEMVTCRAATHLVRFAEVARGQRLLDVGCGTGVVAVTAARLGAQTTGLDLTPELVARARQNSTIAGLEIEWHEGDAEALPFADGAFDVVVSQFGHMFAPRPDVTTREMLRVLRPGGTLAFSTWPPELFTGRMFALTGSYMPPPPPGVSSPIKWGSPQVVREYLGDAVSDVTFDMGVMHNPALSPAHLLEGMETNVGPIIKLVEMLSTSDPEKLATFRRQMVALVGQYFVDNAVRQDFLMTRARKK